MTLHRHATLLVLLAVLAATACSDPPPAPAPVPAPGGGDAGPDVDVVAPVDDVPLAVPGQDLPTFTTEASSADVASTGPDAPILRDVRIATHDGFDRIVFEFDSDGLPQWRVAYIDAPVIQCGSGHEVPVAGAAWLQVKFPVATATARPQARCSRLFRWASSGDKGRRILA